MVRLLAKFSPSTFIIPLILILIAIITYMNILPDKLFFDDEELIYRNAYVQSLKYFPKYFTSNMIEGAGKISNMYRPILTFSYALDYSIWKDNPFGYHLTSLLLHSVNTVLVFLLIYRIFGSISISCITSILFSIHPAISEAVIYASGKTDPLYAFFLLITLILFHSFLKSGRLKLYLFSASIFTFILALLSKESAVIMPILLILIGITSIHKQVNFKKIILPTIPFFSIGAVYVFLRLTVLNFSNTLNFYSSGVLNPDILSYSRNIFIRLFTFTKVFFDYLFLLIFPADLSVARSFTVIKSFGNFWVILFIIFFTASLGLSIKYFSKSKIPFFAFCWFFISILPVSGVIPINNIIAEHYLYLPSISFFLIIAFIIERIYMRLKSEGSKVSFVILLALIIIPLALRTMIRIFDWRDPVTFYTRSLEKAPNNLPMRNNLAMSYAENGQLEKAITEYKKLIAAADYYPNTHHNLANAYKTLGKYDEAEKEYKIALSMDPNFNFSYYGLIDLYTKTGEKEKLEEILKKIRLLMK